jgi:hypothetical protein
MMDRTTKERKLIALMLADLELDLTQPEMSEVEEEVRDLPDEELEKTLASRLDLPYPADEHAMEQALSRIEEPESLLGGEAGSVSGTSDTSHEPLRPGEHEG